MVEVIFIIEYIFNLIYMIIDFDTGFVELIRIFVNLDKTDTIEKSVLIYLILVIYCFYMQYHNYKSDLYKNYEDKRYCLNEYLSELLWNYPKTLTAIQDIVKLVKGLWIWVILILLFNFITCYNYYIFFYFKLLLFFIILYLFVNISENKVSLVTSIWVLIIYCGINTMLIYIYQFTQLKLIGEWFRGSLISGLPDIIVQNFPVIGLEIYMENLPLRFLPHYGSNLLSVLLLWEVKRKQRENNSNRNNTATSNKGIVKKTFMRKQKRMSDAFKNDLSYSRYYFYQVLLVACKYYWLFIFLSMCGLLISEQLSLAFILYVFLFALISILMFKQMISLINRVNRKNIKFYISRLVSYSFVEDSKHSEIKQQYRTKLLKTILLICILYICFIYIYLIFDNIQNYYGKHPIVNREVEQIIRGIAYIIGIYSRILESQTFFALVAWHIYILVFTVLDIYIQRLQKLLNERIAYIRELIQLKEEIKMNIKSRKESLKSNLSTDFKVLDELQGSYNHANKDYDKAMRKRTPSEIVLSFETPDRMIYKVLNLFVQKSKRLISLNLNNHLKISYKIFIKNILEKAIVLMFLLTAIIKLNFLSLFYIIYGLILEIKGKNIYKIYITAIIVFIIGMLQAFLFLSNINMNTDPEFNHENLYFISKYLKLPWYSFILDDSWGFYLGLGVNHYQVATLWCEFIIFIQCFVYLNSYCYSIYDIVNNKISYYKIGSYKSVQKAIENLTEEEFDNMKIRLKTSFNINLCAYDELCNKMNITSDLEGKLHRRHTAFNYNIFNEILEPKHLTNIPIVIKLQKVVYLTFHNYILVLTLILSMMNSGLISIVYIIFSLHFLYKSTDIILGKRFGILKSSTCFFRIFLVIDLILQMAYQLPINKYIPDIGLSNDIFNSIGINKINEFQVINGKTVIVINENILVQDIFKVIIFFLISLMILMYQSKSFKEFYIKYILTHKTKMAKNSAINSFLFNNKRIELMEKIVNYRQQINSTLSDLEGQLVKWESKLNSQASINDNIRLGMTITTNSNVQENEFLSDDEIRDKIKEKIKSGMLIRLAIFLNRRTSSYSFIEKNEKEEYENAILRGSINIKSKIEKKIDEFVDNLDLVDIKAEQIDTLFDMEKIEKIQKNETEDGEVEDIAQQVIIEDDREQMESENDEEIKDRAGDIEDIGDIQDTENDFKEHLKVNFRRLSYDNSYNKNIVLENAATENLRNTVELGQLNKNKLLSSLNKISLQRMENSTVSQIDPQKYQDMINNKLFKKYLTKGYIIYRILHHCFKYFYNNFDIIVFFFMIFNNMINGTLISLTYPLLVFCFGIVSFPRNSKNFWKFVLMYSSIVIVLKFIIQLKFTKILLGLNELKDYYRLGILIFEHSYSSEFLNYIIWDCLVLLFAMMQTYILITKGIWEKVESELETVQMAYDRIFKAKACSDNDLSELKEKLILNVAETNSSFNIFQIKKNVTMFYADLFPQIRV
jgi:hypothetical protein